MWYIEKWVCKIGKKTIGFYTKIKKNFCTN